MIDFESLIPEEITIAPKHPLQEKLELPIPGCDSACKEDIRGIQLRDRIPGVVKRIIPLDADTFWEYWWCVPCRLLLPEDVELIRSDRDRVESNRPLARSRFSPPSPQFWGEPKFKVPQFWGI